MNEESPGTGSARDPGVGDPGRPGRRLLHRGAGRRRPGRRDEGLGRGPDGDRDARAERRSRWGRQEARARRRPRRRTADEGPTWFFGLGVGSGVGWTTGHGRDQRDGQVVKPPGFAPAAARSTSRPRSATSSAPTCCSRCSSAFSWSAARRPSTARANDHLRRGMICVAAVVRVRRVRARPLPVRRRRSAPVRRRRALGGGTIRHVATFDSNPDLRQRRQTTCVDTHDAGPGLRRRRRRAHLQRDARRSR